MTNPLTAKTLTAQAAALLLATGFAVGGSVATAPAHAADVPEPITSSASDAQIEMGFLGSHETGQFDEAAAEITAVYGDTVFTVNAQAATVDVLDASDPENPKKISEITGTGVANSVAIREDGLGVIALEDEDKTRPGTVMFFDANDPEAQPLGQVAVGSLPDMVTLTPDGTHALVANEGEPADDFSTDPEGSVAVIDLPAEVAAPSASDVHTADFHEFEDGGAKTLPEGVRIFGPTPEADLPISRNLEPEYITVAGDKAYATLQEANAIAVVDIGSAQVETILPLGLKDHGQAGNGLDASDRDPEDAPTVNITEYEGLKGAYMPDTISTFSAGGTDYLVTANEGDSREWGDFVDGARVKDLGDDGLAPVCENSPLKDKLGDEDLGRLTIITDMGLSEDGGCYEELVAFGARSFSVWTTDGTLVADSGDEFERLTAEAVPEFFNSNHSESNLEGRSDDKGPEPEALTIGEVGETTYAFVGFERIGGIAAFDLTDPSAPKFATYFNNRDFSVSVEDEIDDAPDPAALLSSAGDLGPEGITFLSADESPTGEAALVVGNEVSGTTSLYSVADLADGGDDGEDSSGDENAGADEDTGAGADAAVGSDADGAEAGEDGGAGSAADGSGAEDDGAADGAGSGSESDAETGDDGDRTDGSTDADGSPLPRTGADLGQYLILGGIALGLIAIGMSAFLLTRRRG
ncbi:choice-of-anchor I family protein [Brevibacterium atlanticum]|uniref:choice-of-anchor I family protein n=1 Tax=Brevibacterium atlanticum TaxID=2697563 RepID=UPI001AA1633A|nr:choice-of-anchor I family protein [Brevibacterium atlanticum]